MTDEPEPPIERITPAETKAMLERIWNLPGTRDSLRLGRWLPTHKQGDQLLIIPDLVRR